MKRHVFVLAACVPVLLIGLQTACKDDSGAGIVSDSDAVTAADDAEVTEPADADDTSSRDTTVEADSDATEDSTDGPTRDATADTRPAVELSEIESPDPCAPWNPDRFHEIDFAVLKEDGTRDYDLVLDGRSMFRRQMHVSSQRLIPAEPGGLTNMNVLEGTLRRQEVTKEGELAVDTPPPFRFRPVTGENFLFEHQAYLRGCGDPSGEAGSISWARLTRPSGELEILVFHSTAVDPADQSLRLPPEAEGLISAIRYERIGCSSDHGVETVVPIFTLRDGSEFRVPVGARLFKAVEGVTYVFQNIKSLVHTDPLTCGMASFAVARKDAYRFAEETPGKD